MTAAPNGGRTRLLYISPLFAPVMDAEAIVAGKLAIALRDAGVDVTVLYDDAPLKGKHPKRDDSSFWASLSDISQPITYPSGVSVVRKAMGWLRYRSHGAAWVDEAIRRAEALHREKPFDVVFSRSLPVYAHVAGYCCAKEFGLPWIARINDPWDFHLVPGATRETRWRPARLRAMFSERWLHKTLTHADKVIFPCRRLMEYTQRMAGMARSAELIPHIGWRVKAPVDKGVFRLLHAGSLTTGTRSALGLLKGLRAFLDAVPDARAVTQLTFLGRDVPETAARVAELGLADVVKCAGVVSYEESLRWMSRSSVCILVEAPMDEGIYLPSKFADYVVSRRPVLALSPEVGTIADYLPDPGVELVDPGDSESIAHSLAGYYGAYRSGTLGARAPSDRLATAFAPNAVVNRLLKMMRKVEVPVFPGADVMG